MKKQILVIHGGNAFEKYDEYLSSLKNKEITLERLKSKDWKSNLGAVLGEEYEVLTPQMPNSQNARYSEWKILFERIIPILEYEIIFVGHSLGAIFLAKYLSENNYPKKIKATFLVAPPYNTKDIHPLVDFILLNHLEEFAKQGGEISIYHSKDDQVVPFSNCLDYQKDLPSAHIKIFEDRQHFNQESFPEIIDDIKNL